MGVLKVEETIATLASATLLQIFEESVVAGISRSNDLNVNLLLVLNVKNDISMLLVFFDFFVRCFAYICYSYS